jgi:preprotein translocase subunit SecD
MNLRENWRVVLLVLFVLGSTFALFGPVAGGSDTGNATAATTGPTNLEYGLELAGGTRIRAPLIGITAENVNITQDNRGEIRTTVAAELNVSESEVSTYPQRAEGGAVEVLSDNVTDSEFIAALEAAGLNPSAEDIREGVTQQTRTKTIDTLNAKINRGGLTGGSATLSTAATGEKFVVIEVPNANRSQVLDLVGDRGVVEIVARYPVQQGNSTGYENKTVLTHQQLQRAQVGTARVAGGQPGVSVTLTEADGQAYANALSNSGFSSSNAANACRPDESPPGGYCLMTVIDGEMANSYGIVPQLLASILNGEWEKSPTFRITTTSIDGARDVQINLKAGALPAELDIDSGTVYFLKPSLAQQFKGFALLAGLVSWLAVSGVVFLRYQSAKVAVPMLLTAVSEVFLLLGFASLVGLALDLSHIAGFIAVIGTGVDDLIIIADEILQEGDVATGRVFQNRFRKAFWVIGAAAATTIVAMSPLTILSLGDLTGFAIVTIVGVLLGVLVTRPAYGDILRNLMLDLD